MIPWRKIVNCNQFRKVWQWFKNQLEQEVPEEIALCEFDCRKLDCQEKDWQNCSRRKKSQALKLK